MLAMAVVMLAMAVVLYHFKLCTYSLCRLLVPEPDGLWIAVIFVQPTTAVAS